MRQFIIAFVGATTFGVACADSGLAADMLMPMKAASTAVPTIDWTGFYVGGNVGYGWTRTTDEITGAPEVGANLVSGGDVASRIPLDPKGFIGGGQIGYNWQALGTSMVFGVEADFAGADISATKSLPGPTDDTRIMTAKEKMDWIATVRGRLGYAPSTQWLAYVTGGLAVGHANLSTALTRNTVAGCNGNNCEQGSTSTTRTGWAVGGGLEHAFNKNWSVKAEYLHFDLGSVSYTMTDPQFPLTIFSANEKLQGNIVRGGINYKFN